MNEFDETGVVRRLHDLMLRKRGVERTHAEIRHGAIEAAKALPCTYKSVLSNWEIILRGDIPRPGDCPSHVELWGTVRYLRYLIDKSSVLLSDNPNPEKWE